MQILNIIAGSLLAAPKLKEWGLGTVIDQWEAWLGKTRETIGLVTFVFGVLAILDRIGVLNAPIPAFGASFPQALPALATGILLATRFIERYPAFQNIAQPLVPYSVWIGLLSMAVGIGSLLFGCFVPQLCRGGLF